MHYTVISSGQWRVFSLGFSTNNSGSATNDAQGVTAFTVANFTVAARDAFNNAADSTTGLLITSTPPLLFTIQPIPPSTRHPNPGAVLVSYTPTSIPPSGTLALTVAYGNVTVGQWAVPVDRAASPVVLSAILSESLSAIRIHFDVPTDRGNLGDSTDCARMLDDSSLAELGSNPSPTCRFVGGSDGSTASTVLEVELGGAATILPEGTASPGFVTLRPGRIGRYEGASLYASGSVPLQVCDPYRRHSLSLCVSLSLSPSLSLSVCVCVSLSVSLSLSLSLCLSPPPPLSPSLSFCVSLSLSLSLSISLSLSVSRCLSLSLSRTLTLTSAVSSPSQLPETFATSPTAFDPTVVVAAPQQVGRCDAVRLDASASTNSGGRAMTFAYQLVAVHHAPSASTTAALVAALPAATASPVYTIPAAHLQPGGTYTLAVTATNFLGRTSAPVHVSVQKFAAALPAVTVLGGRSRVITAAATTVLQGVVSLQPPLVYDVVAGLCVPTNGTVAPAAFDYRYGLHRPQACDHLRT
jgi:hypothetical protein